MITPNKKNHLKKIYGITLVELMVAITIGSIIMLGVGSVYTSSKRSYRLQEEFSRLQENGRFAMNYIARYVRAAGYSGCSSGLNNITNDLNDTGDTAWNFSTGVEGYEFNNTGPGNTPTIVTTKAASGDEASWVTTTGGNALAVEVITDTPASAPILRSDIIVSRSADGNGLKISSNNGGGQVFFECADETQHACPNNKTGYCGLCEGDILLLSDCQKTVAFQATNVQLTSGKINVTHSNANMAAYGGPGNDNNNWGGANPDAGHSFTTGDELLKVSTKVFYIGMGVSGPALFLMKGKSTAGKYQGIELVEGIESLQILYGEDMDATPDNIPDRYVTANDVTNFANVITVHISILVRSVKELPWRTAKTEDYVLGGSTGATSVTVSSPTDKRLRKVMSMTIRLRNRAFSL